MNQADFRALDAVAKERFKDELRLFVDSLGVLTEDGLQFQFRLTSVGDDLQSDGVSAVVIPPIGRDLRVGERAELVCILKDGSYLVRVQVKTRDNNQVQFIFENEIHRLERRNDFRTPVPSGFDMSFQLNSVNRNLMQAKMPLVDVSAKGLRMKWPSGSPLPQVGDHVSGILYLPAGRKLEIFALVRNLVQETGPAQVGLELQNATIRDEQFLLFACMQIHQLTTSN